MTESTEHILIASLILLGGCIVISSAYLYIKNKKWQNLRRRIDTLVKLRVEQRLRQHEANCPLAKIHSLHDNNYSQPTLKSQSTEMLYGFMMTHYPEFMKELTVHTLMHLSPVEEQTCFLIKLGLRNKMIAESMKVSSGTVAKNKQRLRQKLTGMPEEENLTHWIQQMGEVLHKLPPCYVVLAATEEEKEEETSTL